MLGVITVAIPRIFTLGKPLLKFCGAELVVWSSGRLVVWSSGRLVVWSSGRLVFVAFVSFVSLLANSIVLGCGGGLPAIACWAGSNVPAKDRSRFVQTLITAGASPQRTINGVRSQELQLAKAGIAALPADQVLVVLH